MIITVVTLLLSALAGGLIYKSFPHWQKDLRLPLVFVGSYLFAITIVHLVPELFTLAEDPAKIGVWILFGFFIQQLLEYFTSGIEHGHVHDHDISGASKWSLIIALTIHSLLEGSLLTHESPFHEAHESHALLLGIALHKAPAAFALMVTTGYLGRRAYGLLILFSLASPLGLWLGNVIYISSDIYLYVFAIVCGSFLHISTTIFVESSPNHSFGLNKLLIGVLGALFAIVVEFYL